MYDDEGKARGCVSHARLQTLLRMAVAHNENITREQFITETRQLVERYTPLRAISTDLVQKRTYVSETTIPPYISRPLFRALGIRHELFSHPLDRVPESRHAWSPSPLDRAFGLGYDAYSWNWQDINFAHPPTDSASLTKCIKHALQAVKTAPPDVSTATAILLPFRENEHYAQLTQAPECRLLWRLPANSKLSLLKPNHWTQDPPELQIAPGEYRLYLIANTTGFAHVKKTASTAERPWGKLTDSLHCDQWSNTPETFTDAAAPEVGAPLRFLRSFRAAGHGRPEPHADSGRAATLLHEWGFHRAPLPPRFAPDTCIYTDGSKVMRESESDLVPRAAGAVTSQHFEAKFHFPDTQRTLLGQPIELKSLQCAKRYAC